MTNQEIFELMDRFSRSGLRSMKLSTQDTTLELDRGGAEATPVSAAVPVSAAAPAPVAATAQVEGPAVKAPLVGTFYAAPAPGKDPFVAPGDRVTKGQTLCLIEAMKMMSEVSAPCDCVIEEVLKDNGQLVAFGDALVRYKPC
jgi:acetyl-CoA carboxylase biotin carboxyl carrier protein